jgi:hypothetical protein
VVVEKVLPVPRIEDLVGVLGVVFGDEVEVEVDVEVTVVVLENRGGV